MNNIIKIPKRFFEDHRDCCDEEATPKIIKETKKHYFIASLMASTISGKNTTLAL